MPRHQRVKSSTGIYHVMVSGNEKKRIFIDREDKEKIIQIIKSKIEKNNYKIYAYCVMDNHMHLIIHEKNSDLSKIMKRISVSYSMYFNKKYRRTGHVFQDRFKSESIECNEVLKAAVRFVHKNPEKANLGKYDYYTFSSAIYYDRQEGEELVSYQDVLKMFSENELLAKNTYKDFMEEVDKKDSFIEMEEEMEINEFNCQKYINDLLSIKKEIKNKITDDDIREIIVFLLRKSNLSQRYIAEKLGTSKDKVRRVALKIKKRANTSIEPIKQ